MAMTELGIRRTEGGAFCEACGNDLTVDGSAMFITHLDAPTFFENRFMCKKCGATITQRHERPAEARKMWGETE